METCCSVSHLRIGAERHELGVGQQRLGHLDDVLTLLGRLLHLAGEEQAAAGGYLAENGTEVSRGSDRNIGRDCKPGSLPGCCLVYCGKDAVWFIVEKKTIQREN